MHPIDPPPGPSIPIHFHLLRPLEPHPLPLHEKNKNHDSPKSLAQKKCTQIFSPTLQISKISPPSTTAVATRKRT
jgi:hypothetical protein